MKLPSRQHRVRLYTYSDAGSGGVITETYTFREEVWGGFEPTTATERTQGDSATHDRRGRFLFHERVTVNPTDLAVVNGQHYRITGIPEPVDFPQGMLRRVEAVWVDKSNLTVAES